MTKVGGAVAWGTGSFYVMFAGALVGVTTPGDAKGYASADLVFASAAYGNANYATYHKFRY